MVKNIKILHDYPVAVEHAKKISQQVSFDLVVEDRLIFFSLQEEGNKDNSVILCIKGKVSKRASEDARKLRMNMAGANPVLKWLYNNRFDLIIYIWSSILVAAGVCIILLTQSQ